MTFFEAMEELEDNKRVRRVGWTGCFLQKQNECIVKKTRLKSINDYLLEIYISTAHDIKSKDWIVCGMV